MRRTMTMKTLIAAAALVGLAMGTARASGEGPALPEQHWDFKGPFGTFDRAALKRGYQIYDEICSGCHSLKLVAYRNLMAIGFTEDEVKEIAAAKEVPAEPNEEGATHDDDGARLMRPGLPADHFVSPYPNTQAASFANAGAVPPDLSLMIKARKHGPDYVFALLTRGYEDHVSEETLKEIYATETATRVEQYEKSMEDYEEKLARGLSPKKPEEPKPVESIEDLHLAEGANFNAFFPGYAIAMAAPLFDEAVEYADGTKPTLDQHARDVVTFLTWAAQPELEHRKQLGLKVLIVLVVLTAMLFALKRKIWSDVH